MTEEYQFFPPNCSFKRRFYDWQAHGPISVAEEERALLPYIGESGASQHKRAVQTPLPSSSSSSQITLDPQRSAVKERRKPHRPLTAHQRGRRDFRSAGNGRDPGVVLEREVLAPAQRNLGWLEKHRRVHLSTSRGSVSGVSFSILHVYDPAGLWEVRVTSSSSSSSASSPASPPSLRSGFILMIMMMMMMGQVCVPSHCHWSFVWIRTMTGSQYLLE